MSDYSQSIDFSAKDALATGDANKVAKGADIDTELALISTAIATKFDANDIASTAQAEAGLSDGVLMTPLKTEEWSAVWAAENAGIVGDLQALADPAANVLFGWDDTANNAVAKTAGTGIAIGDTDVSLSFLGLEALTDPNVDALVYWDDSDGALNWLSVDNGLTIDSDDTMGLTDVAATTTNPIDISSGAIDVDLEALTTIEGNALVSSDTFLVDDGGVPKGIEYQDMGFIVQTAQGTQTLAAADMNTVMEFTATATLTLPLNATTALPIGAAVILNMKHATQVLTVTADTSVTLVSVFHPAGGSAASDTVLAGGTALLVKTATDVWALSGDVTT